MISQDELDTNNGDTKWLPYKTRMSPALPGTRGLTELSPKADHSLRLLSPQETSRSSGRHPPTFRWSPPLGWSS